ncbi:uncharacterized protein LOC124359403 isoform X2 [Homalodisca vitripennis]|uniref:uncharacterized protein LOC124359403 isoform X2 n=1 Tax=Homalodisca vitripennis TaxID=197043 RepID=UPI001EECF054|nr:uncharacterized protein LOC124359403 isoform X2 [Homalodisca vitripennis]
MIVMDSKDLLTEVSMFLKVTLVGENLSDHAEGCRQKLIAKLTNRDASPPPTQAYVDMNGSSHCHHKVQQQHSNCYEEFDRTFYSNTKDKPHIPDAFMNNLYNNTNSMGEENIYANNDETENYINIKYTSQNQEDNLYINPTSPLANTPVTPSKPSLVLNSTSNSNSERNSVISFKKDSPDRISVSSSLTSNSRCEESPEVLAVSASAMRYKATKTGLLRRREKIFFMDHRKPYWVALINETLFMFTSDKDAKPLFELDISGYKARAVVISASTKPDYKFELIAPGSKTHQFCADNELNMKSWISAINIATKQSDPDPIREWGRQLPSLPAVQNMYDQPGPRRMTCPVTYDQPDSTKQPLIETEYESPDGVASCVSQSSPVRLALNHELSQFLTKGKKSTDQLATPPKQNGERRSPSASGRQSASPRETRRLPLLPHQQLETYDKLEPTVRPVNDNPELYETLCEEVYHCIDDTQLQEALYNNVTEEDSDTEFDDIDDDGDDQPNYCNTLPYPEQETDRDCIYDVITEQRQLLTASPVSEPLGAAFPPSSDIEQKVNTVDKKRVSSHYVNSMATFFSKSFMKPQLKEVKPPVINKSFR